MKKKRVISFLLASTLLVGTTFPLASCELLEKIPILSDIFKQNKEDGGLPEWEQKAELTENGVKLTLTEVDGAEEYNVYHSPSRYGAYELVSTQTELSYTHADKYGYYRVDAMKGGEVLESEELSYDEETFGETMRIYAPTDDWTKVQQEIDEACEATGQFSKTRFSANFKAGKYEDLDLRMRYYMTFSGLGKLPTQTELGGFNVYAELSGGNATCNFWCGIENIAIDSDVQWAVSQATSMRRVQVNGNLALTQKGGSSPWGSGGYISDSVVTGTIDAGNQQQWLTRNSKWGNWIEGDMNLTFVGADASSPIPEKGINGLSTVTVEKTPVISEKPYLVFDREYYVCLPTLRKEATGTSWASNEKQGEYLPLTDFYVARSDRDTADTLNAALKNGKHLFFTPGIYLLNTPLKVEKANTVILGNGLASLQPTDKNRDTLIEVGDVDGVRLGGLILDAGRATKNLLRVGNTKTGVSHADNPIIINDLYFRIGGAEQRSTFVEQSLVINANDVVGDNFWVWRADHSYGVAWEEISWVDDNGKTQYSGNVTVNGAVINGDNVKIYGLMVEHFHEYQTIWNGENGFMAFYQSETPYDAPNQDAYKSYWKNVEYDGWASYKIGDHVQTHTAYGLGIYFVGRKNCVFILDHGIEAPSNAGIHIEHMAIANFSSDDQSGIRHVINNYGKDVIRPLTNGQKVQFTSFIGGVATE